MHKRMVALVTLITVVAILPVGVLVGATSNADTLGGQFQSGATIAFTHLFLLLASALSIGPVVRRFMGLPAFGRLPAHQNHTLAFKGTAEEAFVRSFQALNRVGKVTSHDRRSGTVEGLRGWHPMSSGERLRVQVTKSDALTFTSTIEIYSSPIENNVETDRGSGALSVRAVAREIVTPTSVYLFPICQKIEPATPDA
jgi:hypothetical protein